MSASSTSLTDDQIRTRINTYFDTLSDYPTLLTPRIESVIYRLFENEPNYNSDLQSQIYYIANQIIREHSCESVTDDQIREETRAFLLGEHDMYRIDARAVITRIRVKYRCHIQEDTPEYDHIKSIITPMLEAHVRTYRSTRPSLTDDQIRARISTYFNTLSEYPTLLTSSIERNIYRLFMDVISPSGASLLADHPLLASEEFRIYDIANRIIHEHNASRQVSLTDDQIRARINTYFYTLSDYPTHLTSRIKHAIYRLFENRPDYNSDLESRIHNIADQIIREHNGETSQSVRPSLTDDQIRARISTYFNTLSEYPTEYTGSVETEVSRLFENQPDYSNLWNRISDIALEIIRQHNEEISCRSVTDDQIREETRVYLEGLTPDDISPPPIFSARSLKDVIARIKAKYRCKVSSSDYHRITSIIAPMLRAYVPPVKSLCSTIPDSKILAEVQRYLDEEKPNPDDISSWDMIGRLETKFNCSGYSNAAERNRLTALIDSLFEPYEAAARQPAADTSLVSRSCYQNKNFVGQPLRADMSDVVTFLLPGQSKAECISGTDLTAILTGYEQVYLWKPNNPAIPQFGIPLKYAPVFKLPYSGVFIQANLTHLSTFVCYKLESLGKMLIGSAFGVSQFHGREETLYSAKPIHMADFKSFIDTSSSRDLLRSPFIPLAEDLRPDFITYAGKFFIFTFNGGYSIQDPATGSILYLTSSGRTIRNELEVTC